MKNLIVITMTFLSVCSNLYAGDVKIEISATMPTCGAAGVEIQKVCEAKTQEDIFRVLEIETEYLSEEKSQGACTVKANCSFYQIID